MVGGGKHWKHATPIDPGHPLVAVSCPSVSFCVAADDSGSFFAFDGTGWSPQQSVPDAAGLVSLTCPSSTFCLAVTGTTRALFAFDGTQWSEQAPIPGVTGDLTGVSCAASDWCGASDAHGRVAVLDGEGWGSWHHATGVRRTAADVQCPAEQFCIADVGAVSLIDSSGVWSTIANGVEPTEDLTCASATMCAMAGPGKSLWLFDGTGWRGVAGHIAPAQVGALACAAPSWCLEIRVYGEGHEWDGTRWTGVIWIDPNRGGGGTLSCPAAGFCELTDFWGNVATRSRHGWTKPNVLLSYSYGVYIACGTATFCVAVMSDSFYPNDDYVWNGHHWTDGASNPVLNNPQAVACAAATTFCMAISNISAATSTDGINWTQVGPPTDPAHDSWELSCASPTFCMTTESDGTAQSWNGTAWSTPQSIDGGLPAQSVTCASADWCVAGLGNGQVVTFDGTSWSRPVQVFPNHYVVASCPTTTFCAAIDQDGTESTFDGTAWSTPKPIDKFALASVSCASPQYCAAADVDGNVVSTRTP